MKLDSTDSEGKYIDRACRAMEEGRLEKQRGKEAKKQAKMFVSGLGISRVDDDSVC